MDIVKKSWRKTPKLIRKVLVSIVGCLVIIAGVIMLVLPGPGWVTIFLGIAILASEFEIVARFKDRIIARLKAFSNKLSEKLARFKNPKR